MIGQNMPQFMKHFSTGATLGICVGSLLSLAYSSKGALIAAFIYGVLFVVGFNGVKDDFIKAAR